MNKQTRLRHRPTLRATLLPLLSGLMLAVLPLHAAGAKAPAASKPAVATTTAPAPATSVAPAPSTSTAAADQALAKSAAWLRAAPGLEVEFAVSVRYGMGGDSSRTQGSLLMGPKDRFRLRLPGYALYSDGASLWEHRPEAKQVLVRSVLDLESNLHPSGILFRYLECKALSLAKDPTGKLLELTLDPKGRIKTLEGLRVWLDAGTYAPVRIETRDVSKNVSLYHIQSARQRAQIDESEFRFVPPAGSEVMDLR